MKKTTPWFPYSTPAYRFIQVPHRAQAHEHKGLGMKLSDIFLPNHSVCSECGVHFEPVTGSEARWGNLCSTHRKPVKERDLKKDEVINWAANNWERLGVMMDKELAEIRNKYYGGNLSHGAVLQQQMDAAQQQANAFYPNPWNQGQQS